MSSIIFEVNCGTGFSTRVSKSLTAKTLEVQWLLEGEEQWLRAEDLDGYALPLFKENQVLQACRLAIETMEIHLNFEETEGPARGRIKRFKAVR